MTPTDYITNDNEAYVPDWEPEMIHYCEGVWINGTSSNCSAGLTKGTHKVLLAKPKSEDMDG